MDEINNTKPAKCWYCALLGTCRRKELPNGCDQFDDQVWDDPKIIAEKLGLTVGQLNRQSERFLQALAAQKGYELTVYEPDEFCKDKSYYMFKRRLNDSK